MPSAIVTGATGIQGREIVHNLGQDPQTWETVHALSRSQKEEYPDNVKHDNIDLMGDAKTMAQQLQGVEAEYIFFAAYLQKDSEQELWDVNGAMLRNFLEALQITGAIKSLKRVVLVTGAKQYGLHFGRPKNPMVESDPRVDDPSRPPNFYYCQQDILKELSASASWDWVVTYPNDVIGVASNNFMNLTTSLGLYATVCKEMGGEMPWPGSETFYHAATTFTSSKLQADFCIWAALEPKCGNQAFNVVNGDVESWQSLWLKVAVRFGCTVPKDQLSRKADSSLYTKTEISDKPPIINHASAMGLEGSNLLRPSTLEGRIDLTKWSQREDVKAAWTQLAKREGLSEDVFAKSPWGFLFFVLGRDYDIIISMSKAREYGWTGYKDTWAALNEAFGTLEEIKVLPKRR